MADNAFPKAFVTGFPIKQSKSPKIHGHWLEELRLNGSYEAIEISPDDFPAFIDDIRKSKIDFTGGNVTLPHKEQAFKLVDQTDETASKIGAVNTIYKRDGKLIGSNTDAYGFTANLDDLTPSWRDGKKVVVLGAGGASRAILFALQQAGFDEILLFNRTFERAEKLAKEFGSPIKASPFEDIREGLKDADLFVNTSSLGMNGTDVPELDFTIMSAGAIVTDIVYTPLKTPFLVMAEKQNMKIADGFGMLLHQAVPGFEYWFGKRPVVSKALREKILNL